MAGTPKITEPAWPPRTFADVMALRPEATPENLVDSFTSMSKRENTEYVLARLRGLYGTKTALKGFPRYNVVAEAWRDKGIQSEPAGATFVDFAYTYNPDYMYVYVLGKPRGVVSTGTVEYRGETRHLDCPIILLRVAKFTFTQETGKVEASEREQWESQWNKPVPKPAEPQSAPRISGTMMYAYRTREGKLRLKTLEAATQSTIDFHWSFSSRGWYYQSAEMRAKSYRGFMDRIPIRVDCEMIYDFSIVGCDFQIDFHNRDYTWIYGLLDLQQLWIHETVALERSVNQRDLFAYRLPAAMDYRHREDEERPTPKV